MKNFRGTSLKKRSINIRVIFSVLIFILTLSVVFHLKSIIDLYSYQLLFIGLFLSTLFTLVMLHVIGRTFKQINDGMDNLRSVAKKVSNSNYDIEKSQVWLEEFIELQKAIFKMKDDIELREDHIKAINEELERTLKIMKEEDETKTRFLAVFSHEVRTPLNGIKGLLELVEMEELSDHNREMIEMVGQASTTLLRLANDILDYAKYNAKKGTFDDQPTNIAKLFKESLQPYKQVALDKSLKVECGLAPLSSIELMIDPTKLIQVISNLLSNAIKFTEEGTIRIDGAIKKDNDRYRVFIYVKDSGIGITPEQKEVLFQPFVQADASISTKYGGTGLGLNIIQKIVEHYSGKIECDSEYGIGTTFTCELLLDEAVPSEGVFEVKNNNAIVAEKEAEHILVVEDNEVNQKLLIKLCERYKVRCDIANNGQEGVNKVSAQAYDLVFMDCQMPIMGGVEATKRIREFNKEVPIYAMTAFASKADYDECMAVGMNGFYTKPIDLDELVRLLGKKKIEHGHKRSKQSSTSVEKKEIYIKNLEETSGFDRETCEELIETYIDQSKEILKEISELENIHDFEGIERQLHKLKGASGAVQIVYFQEKAMRAEKAIKEGDIEKGMGFVKDLSKILTLA